MQLILLTEAIDINTKMSDIDVQQPLDDKNVANGQLESKIYTKVVDIKTVASSRDSKQSAEPTTAASKTGKTNKTNAKEDIEDRIGINKLCSEDRNISLPRGDKSASEPSIVEETNDSDITLGGSVANKSEIQNGGQISVKNLFENGEENKSVENVGKHISSQTKNTSVINKWDDCQVPEDEPMEHKEVSLSETENKGKEEPEGSHIEKVTAVKENLENTGEIFKSEGENLSKLKYVDKETTQKTTQAECKLIEDKPKGINEILSPETDNNSAISHVQRMERDSRSEMIAYEIPPLETNLDVHNFKDTMSDIITEEAYFDKNKFNTIEQKCSLLEKSTLIVNHVNEIILQEKNVSGAVASKKNADEFLLPEDDPMEQDLVPEVDNLIITKDDNKTILQKNNKVFDNFDVEDNSVQNTQLSKEEPMDQEDTSQIDVVDNSTKEADIMNNETESFEDYNGDNVPETNETEHKSTLTTDKTASLDTLSENDTNKLKTTTSDKLDWVVMNDSVERHKETQIESFEEERTLEESSTTDKTASPKTVKTTLQKNNKVSDNFVDKDNSVENTLFREDEPMVQENTSQIEVDSDSRKEAEIMKDKTKLFEDDNDDNVSETNETEHKSTTAIPETFSENDTNKLKTIICDKLDWVVMNDSIERQIKTVTESFEEERTFEESLSTDKTASRETGKTTLQKNNKVSENFVDKDNTVENTLLREAEPMEQENTSQIDVVDNSIKEADIMENETELFVDTNGDKVSETKETEHRSTLTTNKTAIPETFSENFTNELRTTTSDKLDWVVMNDSVERHEKTDIESFEESSTTDKTASAETGKTTLQKNIEVSHNFVDKDNSAENTRLREDESMEQENTSQIDVIDNSMKEASIIQNETELLEEDNGDNVSKTKMTDRKSTLTTDKTSSPETFSENDTNKLKTTTNDKLDWVVMNDSVKRHEETKNESFEEEQTFEEFKVAGTSDDNCTESKTKSISILTVKSPTEINKSSLNAEIVVAKKTNYVDTTESSEIEKKTEKNNDLGISERSVDVQHTESIAMDNGDEIALKSNISEKLNEKMETALKTKVNEDSNEKMETEATKIENLMNDTYKKQQSSTEQNDIPEQNRDTKVESLERADEVSDHAFAINYSDEECEIIKSKDKTKSPIKTEEILDTIIACMEVDRGDKKRVVETDKLDISLNKTDITQKSEVTTKGLCNLSNTLDILSDDDDNEPVKKIVKTTNVNESSQNSINIDDDDDVMLIDEEPSSKDGNAETSITKTTEENSVSEKTKEDASEKVIDTDNKEINQIDETDLPKEKEPEAAEGRKIPSIEKPDISEILVENTEVIKKVKEKPKPLVPENFLKTFKTKVADMTREDLEDLLLQMIVEGVVDRSNFSEIKTKLKTMSSNMEEWRKKTMILTKQNRDLQIVLKTVQQEQKKKSDGTIVPLKITRSVGMQVYMSENERGIKRKNPNQTPPRNNRKAKNATNPSPGQQQQKSNAQIPVPRLVPATNNSPAKNTRPSTPQVQNTTVTSNSGVKTSSPHALPSGGVRNSPPVKPVEKRPFSSVQSVTVDLTDDEPPPKQQVTVRNAPQPPVRLVAQNQLLSARAQNQNNGPRKVYIPINSQNQAIRPGQTIMLKSVPPGAGPRPRSIRPMVTIPSNSPVRMPRLTSHLRHPAPLPDVAKQQQPPNWKALPPSPDLKISKVENGIVISWKIEGYQEDSYEQIASYQLYAYQETSTPPSTLLWKKIGDVKALPLPMACTLTQFMAGYKYYFAVRAIDVRSRIGPFSLPGSILLLNK